MSNRDFILQQHHIALADAITATAAAGSTLGWFLGYIPGVISSIVGLVALCWYLIQIFDSPWYKKRHQRKHRRHLRKHRHVGKV